MNSVKLHICRKAISRFLSSCFYYFTLTFFAFTVHSALAQIEPSAVLEINSTSQGVLLSRMTTAQRDAIDAPAYGLIVFNTSSATLDVKHNSTWNYANISRKATLDEITSGTGTKILHYAPSDILQAIEIHGESALSSGTLGPPIPYITDITRSQLAGESGTVTFTFTGMSFYPGQEFVNLSDGLAQKVFVNNTNDLVVQISGITSEVLETPLNFADHILWDNAPTISLSPSESYLIPLVAGATIEAGQYYKIVSFTPFGPDLLSNYLGNNYLNSIYLAIGNGVVTSNDVKAYHRLFEKPDTTPLEFPEPYSFLLTTAGNPYYNSGPTLENLTTSYANYPFYNSDHLSMPHGQGIQVLVVSETGDYRISAWGATGSDAASMHFGTPYKASFPREIEDEGSAAMVSNVFTLAAGTQIIAAVGQRGFVSGSNNNFDGVSGATGGATLVAIVPPGNSFAFNSTPLSLIAGGGPSQGDPRVLTAYNVFGEKSSLVTVSSTLPNIDDLVGLNVDKNGMYGYSGWGSQKTGVSDNDPNDSAIDSYNGGGPNASFSNTRVSESNPNPDPHSGAVLIELLPY